MARIRANKNNCKGFAANESLATVSDTPIYKPILPDSVTCFKNELESISGHCQVFDSFDALEQWLQQFVAEKEISYLFCRDKKLSALFAHSSIPFSDKEEDFKDMQAGLTECEFLVARTGSVVMSSALPSGRQMHAYSPTHFVLAHKSQLVNYVEDAMTAMQNKYGHQLPSSITTVTGPSRTADIEKTLVLGAHGPKDLYVLILPD